MEAMPLRTGVHPSALPGVATMRTAEHHPRRPVLYDAGIVVVLQGHKHGYLDGQRFDYGPGQYLLVTRAMPFECVTKPAGAGRPMLGLRIDIDLATLGELLPKVEPEAVEDEALRRAVEAAPVSLSLAESTARLAETLASAQDAAILGPSIVREIHYRVLTGPHGSGLRALARLNGRLARIGQTLEHLRLHFAEPTDVQQLAADAAMSLSSFHECFRQVTSTTPLQYVKQIRLHRAREAMAHRGQSASEAAREVGYESPSQFSREFKRFFGLPPIAEVKRYRQDYGLEDAAVATGSSQ